MNTVNSPSYFSQTDFSSEGFACRLANLVDLSQKKNGHRPILFLCIGSDRVPGDCLGPLVGYKLERLCDTMHDGPPDTDLSRHPYTGESLPREYVLSHPAL